MSTVSQGTWVQIERVVLEPAERAPTLPEDTNVRRVQERTGHGFGPECGQALMDLGATVCLARVPRCGVCPLKTECPVGIENTSKKPEPKPKKSR